VIPDLWQPTFTVVNMRAIWWDRSRSFSVARREEYVVEGRSEQGLRGGALSTLEAIVISMGFMAPSVAMFFNTPFIAGFAGAAMPLAMVFSFAAVFCERYSRVY
jgi:hypothetical protein